MVTKYLTDIDVMDLNRWRTFYYCPEYIAVTTNYGRLTSLTHVELHCKERYLKSEHSDRTPYEIRVLAEGLLNS